MSFYIGDILIKNKVILAPMAGVTSFSYRKLMSSFDVGLFYTEMISDCGLIYGNKETFKIGYTDKEKDRPLALQLFGGTKETLLKAIDILENDPSFTYDILDINLACPVPKVTRNNGGSSWLKNLDYLYETMSEICKKSSKPVSAKIRLGYNDINVEDTVQILEKAGVKFIAIHARTRKELYTGKPHFDELKNIRNLIKIPFCVSGDIFTLDDAINALEITKADAVMVARGGIGNPLLIKEINNYFLTNEKVEFNRDLETQTKYLKEYVEYLVDEFGERKALGLLKGIAPKFFLKIPNTKPLRKNLSTNITAINDIFNIINEFKNDKNFV